MSAGDPSGKVKEILADLELPKLRSYYQSAKLFWKNTSFDYFHTRDYEAAVSGDEQKQKLIEERALTLSGLPSLQSRFSELAALGIYAEVVAGSEPAGTTLSVFVKFNDRGQRTLEMTAVDEPSRV
jgi:hypothetical protein